MAGVIDKVREPANYVLGIALCIFTLAEVNKPQLQPHSTLAIFAMFGLALCFLNKPVIKNKEKLDKSFPWMGYVDLVLVVLGLVATTFSIAGAFYQAYLVRDKGWGLADVRRTFADSLTGMLVLGGVTMLIMWTAAATLFAINDQYLAVVGAQNAFTKKDRL